MNQRSEILFSTCRTKNEIHWGLRFLSNAKKRKRQGWGKLKFFKDSFRTFLSNEIVSSFIFWTATFRSPFFQILTQEDVFLVVSLHLLMSKWNRQTGIYFYVIFGGSPHSFKQNTTLWGRKNEAKKITNSIMLKTWDYSVFHSNISRFFLSTFVWSSKSQSFVIKVSFIFLERRVKFKICRIISALSAKELINWLVTFLLG